MGSRFVVDRGDGKGGEPVAHTVTGTIRWAISAPPRSAA